MDESITAVTTFFDTYRDALLARDARAIATMYAVPGLILAPGQAIAVSDERQTEEFFASSWDQYDGVETAEYELRVMEQGPGSVWADVAWSYRGSRQERFCYQLIERPDGYRIAVLTPLEV